MEMVYGRRSSFVCACVCMTVFLQIKFHSCTEGVTKKSMNEFTLCGSRMKRGAINVDRGMKGVACG